MRQLTAIWKRKKQIKIVIVNTIMVRFKVLTAAGMKMTVFWNFAPCSLVDRRPDDRSSNNLKNFGHFLPDYVAQHSRRQSS
jgi:hypothetical protein